MALSQEISQKSEPLFPSAWLIPQVRVFGVPNLRDQFGCIGDLP